MDPQRYLPKSVISDFCRRWKITEFAVFGSVLRDDFGPGSDLDVLVTFAADADWTLLDHVRMQQELEALLARPVDLVSKKALARSGNVFRRNAILESARVLHVAG